MMPQLTCCQLCGHCLIALQANAAIHHPFSKCQVCQILMHLAVTCQNERRHAAAPPSNVAALPPSCNLSGCRPKLLLPAAIAAAAPCTCNKFIRRVLLLLLLLATLLHIECSSFQGMLPPPAVGAAATPLVGCVAPLPPPQGGGAGDRCVG